MENANYIFRIHPENEAFSECVEILHWGEAEYVISENTFKDVVEFWTLKDNGSRLIDAGSDLERFEKIVEYVTGVGKHYKRHEQYDFAFIDKELKKKRELKEGYIFRIHPELEGAEKYAEILEDCDAQYVITKSTCSNAIEFCVGYDQQVKYFDVDFEILEDIANYVVIAAGYAKRMEQFEYDIDDIIVAGGGERKRDIFGEII